MASVARDVQVDGVPSPRILILKLVALGDVVMASTMLSAARSRWPSARITWVVGASFAPLVRRFEGVDEVIAVDEQALMRGGLVERMRAFAGVARAIGRRPYALAIVGHVDARYRRLLTFARVREVRALRLPITGTSADPDWMGLDYARLIAPDATTPTLARFAWPAGAPRAPRAPLGARQVVLAPGGARNVLRDDHLRRWPAERWGGLAARIAATGTRVTVIGGPGDREEAEAVARAASVEQLAGKQSLEETVATIAGATLLVSHDSGPLHLAALVGTPAVALFGPTDPRRFVAPSADVVVVSAAKGLACAPCYNGRSYAPCDNNRCLRDLDVAAVAHRVLTRLSTL